ncbi:hypothetical protein CURE108131_23030 [Cupriavidus respiraculi]|uniref:Uncharacterized protein n=1 Tax=Cupriavidus respiraculi TaxID=195930 RepID=A0ABM8WY52_9BURK|nr:hypothetical protein [Cupriavidus respiraculi]CAG9172483.1 hypothetical protein LMG21510_01989 [Cupriavidus respiraculi]
MAQTIEIKGHVYARKDWDNKLQYAFFDFNPESDWFPVCEHTINATQADDFDPLLAQIRSLEQQRERLRAELGKRITEINEQIQSLQALPFEQPISDVDGLPGHIPF